MHEFVQSFTPAADKAKMEGLKEEKALEKTVQDASVNLEIISF